MDSTLAEQIEAVKKQMRRMSRHLIVVQSIGKRVDDDSWAAVTEGLKMINKILERESERRTLH